eukprot:12767753-Alexandrium_andersonii.AAC.1
MCIRDRSRLRLGQRCHREPPPAIHASQPQVEARDPVGPLDACTHLTPNRSRKFLRPLRPSTWLWPLT